MELSSACLSNARVVEWYRSGAQGTGKLGRDGAGGQWRGRVVGEDGAGDVVDVVQVWNIRAT